VVSSPTCSWSYNKPIQYSRFFQTRTNIKISRDLASITSKFNSKKYRYKAIKHKEQSKLKIQKTRLSHEIRRHKWQDNVNLYENQGWNQVVRKGKHFLLRHDVPCVVSRNKTYTWQQYHVYRYQTNINNN